MNFSLKKGPVKRPRMAFDEEPTEKKARESVTEVQEPTKFQIKLGSNNRWLKDAALHHERAQTVAAEPERLGNNTGDGLGSDEETQSKANGVDLGEQETLMFQQDVQRRPEAPQSDVYEQLSVADFGAALLRGIGLDPDDESREKRDKRETNPKLGRDGLMGVGAQASGPGSGTGSGASKKRKDALNVAIPVKPATHSSKPTPKNQN